MSNFLNRSTVGGSVMNKVDKIVDLINRFIKNMGDDKVKIEDIEEVDAVRYYGDGSGLTGIGTGTGGVINEGSTTIGADSDDDGTGEIALQTKGVTRLRVKNDGTLETVGNAEIGDTLHVDSTNDRVGINESNPYAILDINQDASRDAINITDTSADAGEETYVLRRTGSALRIFSRELDKTMANISAEFQHGGDVHFPNNVGIGTTSPDTKLHATGEIRAETDDGLIRVTPTGWRSSSRATMKLESKTDSPADIDLLNTSGGGNHGWEMSCRNGTTPALFFYRNADGDFSSRVIFHWNGDVSIDGTLSEGSTARLKEDIQPLKGSLSTVMELKPKRYHRKTTLEAEEQKEKDKQREREDIPKESGLIAEELIEIMPEAVALDEDGEPAGIAYSMIIPVLANAIQELNAEIEKLKGEN